MLHRPFKLDLQSHRRVLNLIRVHGEISAAELARLSNYQPSTLVYVLRSLKENGLIEVSRIQTKDRSTGKPPTLWRLVADKCYMIGIEIIPNDVRSTIFDFSCHVIQKTHERYAVNIKGDSVATVIAEFVQKLIRDNNLPKEKIIGVGVALPGLIDRKNGMVHFSRRLHLKNEPLQQKLSGLLDLPVEIVNDANAGALGIWWHLDGSKPVPPNVVFLTLNEKMGMMGAGLILNSLLYEGAMGTAGEIFTILPPLAKLIETGKAKFGLQNPLIQSNRKTLTLSDVVHCAQENCRVSQFILRRYAQFLISEIFRIVEFLNPNLIVIGGDITEAEPFISDVISKNVEKKLLSLYPVGVNVPEILFSSAGIYAVPIGATALMVRKIFH
jgi:N-acetylglucosamine repressor